ncbi:hypothetical protein IM774_01350 [Erysipelotrichaceae bacterium RD49]|nr:hypothetical protein [Erysipelotrichaceae bacterium RD49]
MKLKKLLSSLTGAVLLSQCLFGCSGGSKGDLKVVSSKTVELGEPVSLKASEFMLEQPDQSVLDEITVDSDLMTNSKYNYNSFSQTVSSKDKDYLETGTYTVTLDYKGQKYPVTLSVKDTVMPEFVSPAAVVTIPKGTRNFDFSRVYRTTDKDSVTLSVDGDFDVDKVGTYPVTLIATDKSGNSNSLEVTINVVGNNTPIKSTDQFDNELVPSEDDSEDPSASTSTSDQQQNYTTVPNNPSDSTTPTEPDLPVVDNQPTDSPAPSNPANPSACAISNQPAGTSVYRTFSDLYNAGTNWNKQSPNNYFFYLEGTDDCGNKVYFLTTGTQDLVPGPDAPVDPDHGVTQPTEPDQSTNDPDAAADPQPAQ